MDSPPQAILDEISSTLGVRILQVSSALRGFSHTVFVLRLETGQQWSLRIAKNEFAAGLAKQSFPIMTHLLRYMPDLQIPAVIHSAKDFAILSYIDGAAIGSWNTSDLSDQRRHRILDGLADFFFRLWTCPAPCTATLITYREWLLSEVDRAIRRSLLDPSWGATLEYIRRRAKADELDPQHETIGLVARHGDFNTMNVLVDDDGLSGVVDWDTVSFVPAAAAIHHPLFIANIPGFRLDDKAESEDFANDRAYLEKAIRQRSCTSTSAISDLLESSFQRQFLELSLRNKRISHEYAKLNAGEADPTREELASHLASFLFGHSDMQTHPGIVELEKTLLRASQE